MREWDERTLKSSRRYQLNTTPPPPPPSASSSSSSSSAAQCVFMRKRHEDFQVGDLVFAEFPGYPWPALVTKVSPRQLHVTTLILEQEEVIGREHANLFKGPDHLRQLLAKLTPGERHEFAEAESSLKTMSRMNREERLEHMRARKHSPGEEGSLGGTGGAGSVFKENVRKLPCDVDDITLDHVGSHLEDIMNGREEQEQAGVAALPPPPPALAASSAALIDKQQRDESFIVSAVEQRNRPPDEGVTSPPAKSQEDVNKLLTDHLRATRAAQKKALKIHPNVTFEIVQTTERNPSKRGRRPRSKGAGRRPKEAPLIGPMLSVLKSTLDVKPEHFLPPPSHGSPLKPSPLKPVPVPVSLLTTPPPPPLMKAPTFVKSPPLITLPASIIKPEPIMPTPESLHLIHQKQSPSPNKIAPIIVIQPSPKKKVKDTKPPGQALPGKRPRGRPRTKVPAPIPEMFSLQPLPTMVNSTKLSSSSSVQPAPPAPPRSPSPPPAPPKLEPHPLEGYNGNSGIVIEFPLRPGTLGGAASCTGGGGTRTGETTPANDIVSFLIPYYTATYPAAVREEMEGQIIADLERLSDGEREVLFKLAMGSTRTAKKRGEEIISKLLDPTAEGGTGVKVKVEVEDRPRKAPSKRRKEEPPAPAAAESGAGQRFDVEQFAALLFVRDMQDQGTDLSGLRWAQLEERELYRRLAERLAGMSGPERRAETGGMEAFVRANPAMSRPGWAELKGTKQKSYRREAAKEGLFLEMNESNRKLVERLLTVESRKRKREGMEKEASGPSVKKREASEKESSLPSVKKEKPESGNGSGNGNGNGNGNGGIIQDFFCLDCFTLDYNSKQYSTCADCHAIFHRSCLESQSKGSKQRLLCRECQGGEVCGICRKGSNLISCSQCPHKYHESCALPHMSTQVISGSKFICPYHVCGSCEARSESNIKNFVRCVRCPLSFHENHIPAGCMRISKNHILCYRHHRGFGGGAAAAAAAATPKDESTAKRKRKASKGKTKKPQVHINVSFCFQCTFGGELLCCEWCPAAFHNECMPEENRMKPGEVSWLCPDCIVGKKPFIDDIVWVKFGSYRWWPCQVMDEMELPDNIFALPHKPCQFPVQCLGTQDYAWIDMSRVYLYEDGDKGTSSHGSLPSNFKNALIEAMELHAEVKPAKEALLLERVAVDRGSSKKPAPFKFISRNVPYCAAMREYEKQLKLERMPFPCDCTAEDKCSAESNCINRVLLTECPPGCVWGEACQNQRFQRRSYPNTKLVKTEGRGWGMIALQPIKEGEFVQEYVGEIIDDQEVARRLLHYQATGVTDYYILTVENSRIIDAKPKANNARFMNHSCDPNCETQKWNVCGLTCIGLFAKRAIAEGEELTFDYQFDTRGQEKKACLCGAANCSGFLGVPAKKLETEEKKKEKAPMKKKSKKKKSGSRKKQKQPPQLSHLQGAAESTSTSATTSTVGSETTGDDIEDDLLRINAIVNGVDL